MATLTYYTWVLVFALFLGFMAAFGIGANDVANAFATSVGAKSITLRQAVIIASIFEFSGAFFMGSRVTDTIRKGITDNALFEDDPALLMFGMMVVLFSLSVWLLVATYYRLPVSTTHTVVGSLMGVAICARGWDAVDWSVVGKIVLSWVLSPVFSGLFAVILYLIIREGILKRQDPALWCVRTYPVWVFVTVFIACFYTIYKGTPSLSLDEISLGAAIGIAAGAGAFCALILAFAFVPWLEEQMEDEKAIALFSDDHKSPQTPENNSKDQSAGTVEISEFDKEKQTDVKRNPGATEEAYYSDSFDEPEKLKAEKTDAEDPKTAKMADAGATEKSWWQQMADMTAVDDDDIFEPDVAAIREAAKSFDPKTEYAFSYLQVFSACFDAFAHGANDVANSIGPLAAVCGIYVSGEIEDEVEVQWYVLIIGAIGIVVGLALYGYNIIEEIGSRLTKITPSRGFSIELGAALVVITGSRMEIPLSTTHCQIGATVGVGMVGGLNTINWRSLLKIVGGWVITLLVAATITGLVFSFAVCSPSLGNE